MFSKLQKTLSERVSFEGIGLHSGKKTKITLIPTYENQGVIFKRVDIKHNNEIKALYQNVVSAKLCTTLQNKSGLKVSTVEHLLAALYISGIDNVIVEIDNEEVPIMDGSAKVFIDKLKTIKVKNLNSKRKYMKILNKVELVDGKRKISVEPNNSFEVDFQLEYENKIIGNQKNSINFDDDDLKEVIESRTFCLLKDIEKIKQNGLAKGGSLNNAVVVDEDKVLNENGLRNENEFVNHKILDLAGDFLLSGYRILGKIKCHQGGHELTNLFLRKLITKKLNYLIIGTDNDIARKKTDQFDPIKLAANA
tara:strand:- start:612 stop:1535 length:924 start_codon:yes stop_codon:yes gene_type:complete